MTESKRPVIGYVSRYDPFTDKMAWSGTIYKIREGIEKAGFEVRWIRYGTRPMYYRVLAWKLLLRLSARCFGKRWVSECHFRPIVKLYGKELRRNKMVEECDYLFFPGSAQNMLYSGITTPYIYYTDATAYQMIGYYWFDICRKSQRMACEMEGEAIRRAALNLRASQWCIDSVISDGGGQPDKCHVLQFGPNLDTEHIHPITPYSGNGPLRILFSGVAWERKGGDVAVRTVELLRRRGLDARLIIAGPAEKPAICEGKEYVEFYGLLNKNHDEEYRKYLSLYETSHLFLLPTRAECAGIVFSEASAFGLPAYTYLTGGTGSYVQDGINGHTLPLGSGPEAFAQQIYDDVTHHRLAALAEGAMRLNRDQLSWEAWARRFREIMEKETANNKE